MTKRALAVWDFEMLHDAAMELRYGAGWLRRFNSDKQPPVLNISGLVSLIKTDHDLLWDDAYADWRYFQNYAKTMVQQDVRPVQLFEHDDTANDRVCTYVEALLSHPVVNETLDTVFVIGAHDGLLPLVATCREKNLRLVGINTDNPTTGRMQQQCDAWMDYAILVDQEAPSVKQGLPDSISTMLATTLRYLSNETGSAWVPRVLIRPEFINRVPNFRESDYGFDSFSDFLAAQTQLLEMRVLPTQREPVIRLTESDHSVHLHRPSAPASTASTVRLYGRIAAQQGLRLPNPNIMWVGIEAYADLINVATGFSNFKELDQACLDELRKTFAGASMTDAKKVRQVLFKCFVFGPGTETKIGFREGLSGLSEIEDLYFDLMLRRIGLNAPQPIDFAALSTAITGEADQAKRLEEQFAQLPAADK